MEKNYNKFLIQKPVKKLFGIIDIDTNPNERGIYTIFNIADDFDLSKIYEARRSVGSFDYFICSKKKFQEIEAVMIDDLKKVYTTHFLIGIEIRIEN